MRCSAKDCKQKLSKADVSRYKSYNQGRKRKFLATNKGKSYRDAMPICGNCMKKVGETLTLQVRFDMLLLAPTWKNLASRTKIIRISCT